MLSSEESFVESSVEPSIEPSVESSEDTSPSSDELLLLLRPFQIPDVVDAKELLKRTGIIRLILVLTTRRILHCDCVLPKASMHKWKITHVFF